MWFFPKADEVDLVLFSPLTGVLTFNGEPAVGARMKLWLGWKDKKGESLYFGVSDSGEFSIPAQVQKGRISPFAQLVITQKLTVDYNGATIPIWIGSKLSPDMFAELGGRPLGVSCELAGTEMAYHTEAESVATLCQWQAIEVAR